jgi:hypothetical protein
VSCRSVKSRLSLAREGGLERGLMSCRTFRSSDLGLLRKCNDGRHWSCLEWLLAPHDRPVGLEEIGRRRGVRRTREEEETLSGRESSLVPGGGQPRCWADMACRAHVTRGEMQERA